MRVTQLDEENFAEEYEKPYPRIILIDIISGCTPLMFVMVLYL